MLFIVVLHLFVAFSRSDFRSSWKDIDNLLQSSIDQKIFPGCSSLVYYSSDGILYEEYFGRHEYDNQSIPVSDKTLYDLASLTKVLITTTAIAQFYQRDELKLTDRISDYFKEFSSEGKESITISDCLLHQAGFPPDPLPGYWEKDFGCEQSEEYHPKVTTDCQKRIKEGWFNQQLMYPIGSKYLYSDLSMISLHYVIGYLAKKLGYVSISELTDDCNISDSETCFYNTYIQKYILKKMNMEVTSFNPYHCIKNTNITSLEEQNNSINCAPTSFDSLYRHQLSYGYCQNRDSYANGGINGHAGVFSNPKDMIIILRDFMFENTLLNKQVVELFTTVKNTKISSRALGWDTNVFMNSTCGSLSKTTYLHTGYTGTQICCDHERKLITILLTNRVYPDDQHKTEILEVRTKYNTIIQQIVDGEKKINLKD